MEGKRLAKHLAERGIASRRASEQLILDGQVIVNGEIETSLSRKVGEEDIVLLQGKPLPKRPCPTYLAFHKPRGYECSRKSVGKSVFSLLPPHYATLFYVGRLDKESSGLLFFSNDGEFCHHLAHPSFGVKKHYLIKTHRDVTAKDLGILDQGTEIEGKHRRPLSVRKIRRNTIRIVVAEGKKHEVRLFAEAARLIVHELIRIQIGNYQLGHLPPGKWKHTSPEEIVSQ
ncbi:pseudouridine synthase [Candidatus Similichlamydia laticola]|uniref:Pseudouridine synthase B n=1 Tax=Candidatus Similichlamydia laticola TaxID=2170265 RepID=A0A369KEC5_9BACT|nr:pseudouridine synthase B [Candidatus Similichlamydia laticola]